MINQVLEFTGNHTLLVVALVVSLFMLIFVELRRKAGDVLTVPATDAVRLMNSDAQVLDLRSVEAFNRGHIVNARNIPLDELDARLDKLGELKTKTIVAVCDAGMHAGKAVEKLRKAGFDSVYGLKGGMTGWSQEGMPVVTGKKILTTRPAARKGKDKGKDKKSGR
ncbi:MAG TPA: rhodanese-like domain-containing protein [Woeseiaceae bacterium]|nr:rhodanese-like domain-containing protein [Woeseiaceae bacterium]